MIDFQAAQEYMRSARINGWLVYDFRGSNPIFAELLPGKRMTTRRMALFVPARGEPTLGVQLLDANQFQSLPLRREQYVSWEQWRAWLAGKIAAAPRLALEYSPGAALPVISIVDAGTVELLRSLGAELVSSANLVQVCVAQWSSAAVHAHAEDCIKVERIKDAAFDFIRRQLAAGKAPLETDVQREMLGGFAAAGLETPDAPIVAVNAHSGDPHYEPSERTPTPIRPGDWVLIDLWARRPGNEHIFCDITWVGQVGRSVPPRRQEVFDVVKRARDACVARAQAAYKAGEAVQGWQLDEAARAEIIGAGLGDYIKHRTGHSLSPGERVHGLGLNLDNLETHDTRELLPGLGFTVEPGVYLPEFGVRLEINVFADPAKGPIVTSCVQERVVLLE